MISLIITLKKDSKDSRDEDVKCINDINFVNSTEIYLTYSTNNDPDNFSYVATNKIKSFSIITHFPK